MRFEQAELVCTRCSHHQAAPSGVRYLGLPVLDGELHRDPQPLPVARGLGNVITDLLGRLKRAHPGVRQPSAEGSRAAPRRATRLLPPGGDSAAAPAGPCPSSHGPRVEEAPPPSAPAPGGLPVPSPPLPDTLPAGAAVPTRPRGPILGARAEVAPTSPPVHRRYTAGTVTRVSPAPPGPARPHGPGPATSPSSPPTAPLPIPGPARTDFDLVGVELGRHGGGAGNGWRRMR